MFKRILFVLCSLLLMVVYSLRAQVENVPVENPVYTFLKRMDLKNVISNYRDVILPISRKQVAKYLQQAKAHPNDLTETERQQLDDFSVEFQFDLSRTNDSLYTLIDSNGVELTGQGTFNNAQKYLYAGNDSSSSIFIDCLLTYDARRSDGDALGHQQANFVQFGGRIRGTLYDKLGYFLYGTNAQFWGSRDVLRRDKYISQAYTLGILDAKNFDLSEGYVRYESGIISAELGQERLLWGHGYGDKMIVSDNVRQFPFVRADVNYKGLTYTFMHGWLLGSDSSVRFQIPGLTGPSSYVTEPVVADKYIAAHRLGLTISSMSIGFQEMAIYSNRSVDLAYLNPLILIESAQRSRQERDNILWAFDAEDHVLHNVELQGTLVLDDLNFPKLGTSSSQNKFAVQGGTMVVDPICLSNTSIAVEYTRVNPYTFSHERSRDDNYGSFGQILSHHIGPNSDSWFFKFDYQPMYRLSTSFRFELQRHGEDVFDSTGNLVKNVGGDYLIPQRDSDPQSVSFLDGNRVITDVFQIYITYEIINQVLLDCHYQLTRQKDFAHDLVTHNHDYGITLRLGL